MNYRNKCLIFTGLILFLQVSVAFAANTGKAIDKTFVGREACAICHIEENEKWIGSHHDLAMQEAKEKTVLGDFGNTRFKQFDVESIFFRKGDDFMVRTDGPDGKLNDYRIKYTFGFFPLQQYLIEFPDGRLQALDIAWDSRMQKQGGQRWIHLHADEKITHDDVLHWTGPNLNWNYMCADCHSTNLEKNYNAKTDSYHSTWSELDVSCEACHGPGSEHLRWLNSKPSEQKFIKAKGLDVSFDERQGITWKFNKDKGIPQRSQINTSRSEVQVCARCHSRRSQIAQPVIGEPFMNAYIPSLLVEGLYHPDGQIQDEVYVYGSFLQSKMYQKGVTCSDCHDPHSNELKLPRDQVCTQCHSPDQYARKEHHFHDLDSEGSSCVECHMPATIYMEVDDRHDHSFRIPRPDLSVSLATPNACNKCHTQQTSLWATEKMNQWYGQNIKGNQTFATSLQSARTQNADVSHALQALSIQLSQPNIVRATALEALRAYPERETMAAIQQNLNDPDPLLRRSALAALRQFDIRMQVLMGFPLLSDPVRAVRVEAVSMLVQIPRGQLSSEQQLIFQQAVDEYIQVQLFNAERPEAQVNLGGFYNALGEPKKALLAYQKALKLQLKFVPAYVYLAQIYSAQGKEHKAERLLKAGIKEVPESADLAEAMGLSLVRQKKNKQALNWLARATQMDQDNGHYAYVYGIALNSTGNSQQALHQLQRTYQRFPENTDVLYALVAINRDTGKVSEALKYIAVLETLMPGNRQLQQLKKELSSK